MAGTGANDTRPDAAPGLQRVFGTHAMQSILLHLPASALWTLCAVCRETAGEVAGDFRGWLRRSAAYGAALNPGEADARIEFLAWALGIAPHLKPGSIPRTAEWNAFRKLFRRYGLDVPEGASFAASLPDPRSAPTDEYLSSTHLSPVVREKLAVHAWAGLYYLCRADSMPEDGAPAGAEGDSPRARSIFLHLDRTWTLVWLFDGPLPSAARDGAQKYDRAALVEGHLDAFPTPSAVAGKALYPRMLLLLAAHGEARVLSAMLTLFGRPARGFDEPGSTTRHWLRLGSGLEVEPKGGPWWRYALASDGPGPEVADVMREHRGMLVPFVEEEELPGWGGPGAAGPAWADDSDSEAENAGQEQPGGVPVVVEVDGDEEGWEEALAAAVAVPGTGDQEE